jgi:hypothetical protein
VRRLLVVLLLLVSLRAHAAGEVALTTSASARVLDVVTPEEVTSPVWGAGLGVRPALRSVWVPTVDFDVLWSSDDGADFLAFRLGLRLDPEFGLDSQGRFSLFCSAGGGLQFAATSAAIDGPARFESLDGNAAFLRAEPGVRWRFPTGQSLDVGWSVSTALGADETQVYQGLLVRVVVLGG